MIEFFIYLHWNSFDCCVVDKINLVLFRMSPLCPLKASSFYSLVSVLMQPLSPTRCEYLPFTPSVKSLACVIHLQGRELWMHWSILVGRFLKYIYERGDRSSRCSRRWTGSLLPCQDVDAPSLEVFGARLDGARATSPCEWQPCPWQRGWNEMISKFLPIQYILWFYSVSLLLGEFFVLFRNNPMKLHELHNCIESLMLISDQSSWSVSQPLFSTKACSSPKAIETLEAHTHLYMMQILLLDNINITSFPWAL